MTEEEKDEIGEFVTFLEDQREQTLYDINTTDVESLKILIKLAKSVVKDADSLSEEARAIRHIEKRIAEMGG